MGRSSLVSTIIQNVALKLADDGAKTSSRTVVTHANDSKDINKKDISYSSFTMELKGKFVFCAKTLIFMHSFFHNINFP